MARTISDTISILLFAIFRTWSNRLRPKSIMLTWRCHQLFSEFLINDQLPGGSRQSHLSATDKGDNGMKLGAVLRYPGICLTAEGNPWKSLLWNHPIKILRPIIASNGVPCLQMRLIGLHNRSARRGEKYINLTLCKWVSAMTTISRL